MAFVLLQAVLTRSEVSAPHAVISVFVAFLRSEPFPSPIRWRDISDVVGLS